MRPTFPALWIAAEKSFGVEDAPLTLASEAAIRGGFFEGLRFLDSSGRLWPVLRVRTDRPISRLDRFLNRRLHVDLEFGTPTDAALAELVDDLCVCVDADPDDLYDQFMTRAELKKYFRAATSARELIERARTLGGGVATGGPHSG